MKPFKLSQICEITGGRLNREEFAALEINGVDTDSRHELIGKIFVPLLGERVDGHDYIASAFENEAVAAFSERECGIDDKPVIYVDSTKKALKMLAKYYRLMFSPKVIAITGSVGKTTVKDLIHCVLSQKYNAMKTKGNLNTHIGLPLTLFELDAKHEIAVLEMGMRNFGEIRELAEIAVPDVAVITNIGVSHIEILGSREGILQAKSELIEALDENGSIVLNGDDDMLASLKEKFRNIVYFGTKSDNDFWYGDIKYNGVKGVTFTLHKKDKAVRVFVPVPGRHMVTNALCAAAVGDMFGLSLEEIQRGIENFVPTDMRMTVLSTAKGYTVINDVYNASPASMEAAFEVLAFAEGRKICVLGDMLELGDESQNMHTVLGESLADKNFDYVYAFGNRIRHTAARCSELSQENANKTVIQIFDSKAELSEALRGILKHGDTVLVKASRSLAFEDIVKELVN